MNDVSCKLQTDWMEGSKRRKDILLHKNTLIVMNHQCEMIVQYLLTKMSIVFIYTSSDIVFKDEDFLAIFSSCQKMFRIYIIKA